MKKFVFFSDFDNTISKKDFYQIVIDKYMKEYGDRLFTQWKKGEMKDIDFLNAIFNKMGLSEEQIIKDINEIPIDVSAIKLINLVQQHGGDFVILSAGTSYYIEKIIKSYNINGVRVISNTGTYKDGGIYITPEKNSPYYSDIYGIDKCKVVLDIKKLYEKSYYAGDSKPDLMAAMNVNVAFAKSELQELMKNEGGKFIPFSNFDEIITYLTNKGVF